MDANALVGLFVCTALANRLLLDRAGVAATLRDTALHGVLTALVSTLAAAGAWLLRHALLPLLADLPHPPEFVLVLLIAATTAATALLLSRWRSALRRARWWLIATNAGGFAAGLLVLHSGAGLAASLLTGFGAGCAFAACLVLLHGLELRLQPADVPAAFRGLPIALLNAGLLALAGIGLAGLL